MSTKSAPLLIKKLLLLTLLMVVFLPLQATIDITGQVDATTGQCNGRIEVTATGTAGPFTVELNGPSVWFEFGVSGTIGLPDLCPGLYNLIVTDAVGCEKVFDLEIQECPAIDLPPYISSVTIYTLNTGIETKIYQAFWTESAAGDDHCIQFQPNNIPFPESEVTGIQNGQRTMRIQAVANNPMNFVGLSLPGLSVSPQTGAFDNLVWEFLIDDQAGLSAMYNAGLINQPLIFVGQAQNGLDLLDLRAITGSTGDCIAYPRRNADCTLDQNYYQYGSDDVHVLSNCGQALQARLVAANAPCDGTGDGFLCIEVSGGVPPYTHQWEAGSSTECLNGLATFGCQAVTITDACGAELQTCFSLPTYEALNLTISDNIPSCQYNNNGRIEAIITGGKPPFTYTWTSTTGSVTQPLESRLLSLDNLPDDDYQLALTDACGSTQAVNVVIVERINTAIAAWQGIKAFYTCNQLGGDPIQLGNIDLQIDPAFDDVLTYEWSNGAQTQDVLNVAPGTYTVAIRSSDGCVFGGFGATVEEEFSITETIVADCSGADQSSIALEVSGNHSGTVSYSWSTGATTASISNLSLATYCVTVTSGIGCIVERCYDLQNPPGAPALELLTVNHPRINPEGGGITSYGSVTFAVSGEQAPFTLSWAGEGGNGSAVVSQAGSITLDNFQVGYHQFTLTDAQGCTDSEAVNFESCNSFGTNIVFPIDQVSAISNFMGGAIIPQISDGNPPFQYSWTGPDGFTSNEKDLSDLQTPGEYCLTVIDDCEQVTVGCLDLPNRCINCVGVGVYDPCLEGIFGINGIGKGTFYFASVLQTPPFSSVVDLEWYDEDNVLLNTGKIRLVQGNGGGNYSVGCLDYVRSVDGSTMFEIDQVISGVSEIDIWQPGTYRLVVRDQVGCTYEASGTFYGENKDYIAANYYDWDFTDNNGCGSILM